MYCKCVYYWSRHIKEDNILLSNFVMVGEKIGFKKENKKFLFINPFRTKISFEDILAKYVRILVKSVQLGYSSGNLSESFRIYQRPGATASKPAKDTGNCFCLYKEIVADQRPRNMLSHEPSVLEFHIFYVKILDKFWQESWNGDLLG